jgi:hypothetical protein
MQSLKNFKKQYFSIFELYKNGKIQNSLSQRRTKTICHSKNGLNSNDQKRENNFLLEKGCQSIENPVLRGSFCFVLTNEQMDFFDKIAKTAFAEIMNIQKPKKITFASPDLYTHHLTTDQGKVIHNRPGVYVIMNVQTGECIIGQTVNLKKRFNQYTSRGKAMLSEKIGINKNFFLAVQKELKKGFDYSQFIQRFVVYTWVDENKKPLDVQNSLSLQNEMNYLEHRLILAFYECNLCYNIQDVSLKFAKFPNRSDSDIKIEEELFSQKSCDELQSFVSRVKGPNQAKPFQVEGQYFLTTGDYAIFRKSLEQNQRKKFLAIQNLRRILQTNKHNLSSNTRYLTFEEIQKAWHNNLFIRPK